MKRTARHHGRLPTLALRTGGLLIAGAMLVGPPADGGSLYAQHDTSNRTARAPASTTLRQSLDQMAASLAATAGAHGLEKVAVFEFSDPRGEEAAGGYDFRVLGRFCADELERCLLRRNSSRYRSGEEKVHFQVVARHAAMLRGGERAVAGAVRGSLRRGDGHTVVLRCELVDTGRNHVVDTVSATAALNTSQWAMTGRSVQVIAYDPGSDSFTPPPGTVDTASLADGPEGNHPLDSVNPLNSASKVPFDVEILVRNPFDGKMALRQPRFQGNEMFMPLEQGEVYAIRITNFTGRPALMRLTVDGLNTLPEKPKSFNRGVYVVPANEQTTSESRVRVNLDAARPWVLDPAHGDTSMVRGFFSATGAHAKYNEFVVVDAAESRAAQQGYVQQIGLITAAFYEARGHLVASPGRAPLGDDPRGTGEGDSRSPVGTGEGAERDESLRQFRGVRPGNLLGVIHVRYGQPDTRPTNNP